MPQFSPAILEQIKQLVPISRLVGEYVEADKRKSTPGDLWACCAFHNERTPSFHAEDAKGIYHCFGCGATGDHFQWMQEHQGMTFTDAVVHVAGLAGVSLPGEARAPVTPKTRAKYDAPAIIDPYEGYEFIPVPAGTPPIVPGQRTPALRNPKKAGTDKETTHYKPSAVYAYENAAGELLGYVLLVEFKDGKSTPGIWWARGPDGFEGWCHGSLENAPLYGLPELLAHPDKQVLVVEGEKCRDRAREALQDRVVVVSWCGGTNRVDRSDWTPLSGRSVIWWSDNDDEGRKAMNTARGLAGALKNKLVTEYGQKGGDVADLIATGGSVAGYIKANISEFKETGDDAGERGNNRVNGSRNDPSAEDRRYEPVGATSTETDIPPGIQRDDQERENTGGTGRSSGVREDTHQPLTIEHRNQKGPLDDEGPDPTLAIDPELWENHLIRTDAGSHAKKSPQNAMLHIQFHPDFAGIFAYNDFSRAIMLMRRPPWQAGGRKWTPRVMDEDDETALQGQLEYCNITIGINDLSRCIARVAKHNKFNPVRDRLKSLTWDGVKRLSGEGSRQGWLTRYFGAEPTEINRVFGRKWFVSACSRICNPGSQVDTVLIIEGGQGAMKSTSFRLICSVFGDDYFLDNLADPYSKDGKMAVQGKIIVELAELEAFRRSEESQKKSWITTRIDEFRPPFARAVRTYPRTFVIVGTENPTGTGYLKDSTGARRYWPVMSNEIDYGLLKEDVEQLWAEAYAAYAAGEVWWLTKDEEVLASVEQRKRFKHDPWLPSINKALVGEMSTNPVKLMEMLDIPKKDRTVASNDRVVAILSMLQWEPRVFAGEIHYYKPVMN